MRSIVAIDLKIGKVTPEHEGKMNFYLSFLDDTEREPDENPFIGIVLCKSKNETIVEYALRGAVQPLGVATYRTHGELPADFQRELPVPAQIARLMESIE